MRDWKCLSLLILFWLACFTHLYPYILSYSCCFFVMFVYLRLIFGWIEREPISHYLIELHITLSFWICWMGFTLSVWMRGRTVSLLFKSRNVFHWAVTSAYTFKIGYFIYLSQKNSLCCMLYMYQKDKKKVFFPLLGVWHVSISS